MTPLLFADDTPPDRTVDYRVFASMAVVVGVSLLIVVAVTYWGDRWWVGVIRRRLGRRGLVMVFGVMLMSMSVTGVYGQWHAVAPGLWWAHSIWVTGPLLFGVGLYAVCVAIGNRPRQVNEWSRVFSYLPDVPRLTEPLPPSKPPQVSADEQAFLAAIAAAPDDDLHRLVYADWLDERNDPRGEYVRLVVAAIQGDEAAELRRVELFPRFDPAWAWAVHRPVGFRDDSDEPDSP